MFPGAGEGRLDLRREAGAGGGQEGRESAGPTECEDCLRRLGAERLKLRVPQHRRLSPFRAGFPSSRAAPPPAPGNASAAMARLNAPPGDRDGACKASDVGRPGGAGVAKRLRGQSPLKAVLPFWAQHKTKSPGVFRLQGSQKNGGYLLSQLVCKYHRRDCV